ncbi:MAG: NADPH-adrenodoxin reductase [Caeruleum heppii]|nr:MAG: NADPH-adrenodoxin reductase [Caeruleum heppii]
MQKLPDAHVDMYERLPVPFGLVRFGVAPDHPEVKNCQDRFTQVAESINFNFVGNIPISPTLPLNALTPHYHALLFAHGASHDRTLGIPGESSLSSIYSARAFVGWYNGLPEYADLNPDLARSEEAVVIGQGNVALDIARTLLSPLDRLKGTDVTEYAFEGLKKSRIKRVRVVGRRGVCQAAFTIREVRELMHLPAAAFHPLDPSLLPDPKTLPRAAARLTKLLAAGSIENLASSPKSWSLDFNLSPQSFHSSSPALDPSAPTATDLKPPLTHINFARTRLIPPNSTSPSATAVPTGETTTLKADIAFRSIGYKSASLPGMSDLGVTFDEQRGVVPNDGRGRVLGDPRTAEAELEDEGRPTQMAIHAPGLYVAGWAKRGPTGVIASTMADAFETADVLVQDWGDHALFLDHTDPQPKREGWDGVKALAESRGLRRVSWTDWEKIDREERRRGRDKGKEREKLAEVEEMLRVLD